LFFAHQGQIRKRQQDDLSDQSGCLTLVTNAVVAWNTIYIAKVLEELRLEGYPVLDDDVSHLSPLHSAGYLRQKIIFTRRSTEKLQN
jgi:hypothetical protein